MNNIYNKYSWVIIVLILFMSIISISVIHYSFGLGQQMAVKHSILIDVTMKAKYEITYSHLWTEELLAEDPGVTSSQVNEHFQKAEYYLKEIIKDMNAMQKELLPTHEESIIVTTQTYKVLELLKKLQYTATLRVKNKQNPKITAPSDIYYDALFQKIILQIGTIETSLENITTQDLHYFYWTKNILIMIILGINILILISYRTILKLQKEWLLKHFKVESEKNEIDVLYKEIKKAQNLIDQYIPISRTDISGNITHINQAMCNLTGYTKEELLGKNHRILRFPTEKVEKYKAMWESITSGRVWEGEVKNLAKCGEEYWVNAHIHPIYDDHNNIVAYQALREDITHKKELEYLSSHDKLTNIYNRSKFDELLEYEIGQFSRYKKVFSLAIFDLDYFKNINDTYGHQIGDEVLQESVLLIKSMIRDSDVLARWGGEEFTLLLSNTNKDEALIVVNKIVHSIQEHPFKSIDGLTISCGLSEITKEDSIISLIKRIDDALYTAKKNGRNQVTLS